MFIKKSKLKKIISKILNEESSKENKSIDNLKLEKKKDANEKKYKDILKLENPNDSLVQFAAFLQSNTKDEDLKNIPYMLPTAIKSLNIEEKEYTYSEFERFGSKVKIALNNIKSNQNKV